MGSAPSGLLVTASHRVFVSGSCRVARGAFSHRCASSDERWGRWFGVGGEAVSLCDDGVVDNKAPVIDLASRTVECGETRLTNGVSGGSVSVEVGRRVFPSMFWVRVTVRNDAGVGS